MSVPTVNRIKKEHRWSEDCVRWVKWAPRHKYKGADDVDGGVPEGVPEEERSQEETVRGDRTVVVDTRETAPRDFYISYQDAKKYGFTRKCGGCSSWSRGLGRAPAQAQAW